MLTLQRIENVAKNKDVRSHVSQNHNLPEEKRYKKIDFPLGASAITLQYFKEYSDPGHSLAYFQGNQNIPPLLHRRLVNKVHRLPEVQSLFQNEALIWRLTVNYYHTQTAKFEYHVDVPENGVFTTIATLKAAAQIELKRGKVHHALKLLPGSLLFFTGEARYDWMHRVIPFPTSNASSTPHRISLVLGAHPLRPKKI